MNLIERIKAFFVDKTTEVDTEIKNIMHDLAAKVEAIEEHLLHNNDSLPYKYAVPSIIAVPAATAQTTILMNQSGSLAYFAVPAATAQTTIPANTAATGDAAAGSEAVKTGDGGQQNDLIAKTGDAGSETVKTDAAQV